MEISLSCGIAAEISEAGAGSDLAVEDVIPSLGCIQVREYCGVGCISETDKRQREMNGTFDISIHKEATSGKLIFDAL